MKGLPRKCLYCNEPLRRWNKKFCSYKCRDSWTVFHGKGTG